MDNVKKGKRIVSEKFKNKIMDTYTFLGYKLVQKVKEETNPDKIRLLNRWFNIFKRVLRQAFS